MPPYLYNSGNETALYIGTNFKIYVNDGKKYSEENHP